MAPADFLWRLVETATGRRNKHEPVISSTTAALASILFTLLYVIPFYLSPKTRPSPSLNRDAPSVIQARIRAVTITVTVTTAITFYLLRSLGRLSFEACLHQLGFWPVSLPAVFQPLLLTLILYLGPLYKDIYLEGSLTPLSGVWSEMVTSLASSIGYRNYVAGPVTEELLFRSSILPIHIMSPLVNSPKKLVFLTPLYFGIAHVHHFYEFRLTHPDTPLTPAVLRTVLQFGYTTIFGWFASFVYLRIGNIYTPILIHVFCNYMGLPKLWGKIRVQSTYAKPYRAPWSGTVVRGKEDTERDSSVPEASSSSGPLKSFLSKIDVDTIHTFIYYTLLLGGVYTFWRQLFTLTAFPDLALVNFSDN